MLRKTIIALAAVTVAALTLPAGDADARPFHRGGYHGRAVVVRSGPVFVHRRPVFVHRRAFVRRAPIVIGSSAFYGRSCWRLVPTAFGLRRVWVCPRYWAYRGHWAHNLYVGIQ